MSVTEEALISYITGFLWPFLRISAMFLAMPIISVATIPSRYKVIISMIITSVILPTLPAMPVVDVFGFQGWMVTIQQIALGFCSGFILQMVFSMLLFAGQSIAFSMGLGFASLIDPSTGVQVPVIAQLFIIMASLLFLSIDGHLLLIEMLAQSFHSMPVAMVGLDKADLWRLIIWSSLIFANGVLLGLPLMASMLFVNISFGVASKAAPQLQLFGIGFMVSIMVGMLLIALSLSNMLDVFADMLREGFGFISQLLRLQ